MIRVFAGLVIVAGLSSAADKDMQRAIAWERHKDAAAARQARIEARHPSVTNSNSTANRSVEEDQPAGRPVKDPGPGKDVKEKK